MRNSDIPYRPVCLRCDTQITLSAWDISADLCISHIQMEDATSKKMFLFLGWISDFFDSTSFPPFHVTLPMLPVGMLSVLYLAPPCQEWKQTVMIRAPTPPGAQLAAVMMDGSSSGLFTWHFSPVQLVLWTLFVFRNIIKLNELTWKWRKDWSYLLQLFYSICGGTIIQEHNRQDGFSSEFVF